ncbi:unnamed protein product, partial [Choristocarpus tenellus]
EHYDNELVNEKEAQELGEELRRRLETTADAVLAVSGATELISENRLLQWQLSLRNPYVDPINIMQVDINADR